MHLCTNSKCLKECGGALPVTQRSHFKFWQSSKIIRIFFCIQHWYTYIQSQNVVGGQPPPPPLDIILVLSICRHTSRSSMYTGSCLCPVGSKRAHVRFLSVYERNLILFFCLHSLENTKCAGYLLILDVKSLWELFSIYIFTHTAKDTIMLAPVCALGDQWWPILDILYVQEKCDSILYIVYSHIQ